MRSCLLLATLLAFCGAAWGQDRTAVVSFNARGISGYIQFIELDENSTRIRVNLQGLRGNHTWHVHTLPIDQTRDPAIQCLSSWAGPHYDPFNARGSLTTAEYQMQCTPETPLGCEAGDLAGKFGPIDGRDGMGQVNVVDTTGQLRLQGPISIIGRSVVIHDLDGSNFECGTIRLMGETGTTVLQATFISPVAGTVYFRQVPGEEVQMWGKLYWVNDTATTFQHNWHIHTTAPGEEYRVGMCDNIGPHYDPTENGPTNRDNYTMECTPQTPSMCEIGDLTGKHDTINIAARPADFATYSFFFTDSFLNLTGVFAVEGRALAIHVENRGGPMIACAPLVASETITLNDYRTNYLSVSQQSPFEDTIFTSSASPPARLTILNAALTPHDICPPTSSTPFDRVYSPYPVDSSINTPDRYPLGDLQDRFNSNLNMANNRFNVFDMPVYGSSVTISGLTLRQGASEVGRCSAFIPAISGDGVIAAKASFTGEVGGNIIFIQRYNSDGTLGNTSTQIYVDIYYSARREMTTGHNWHVHETPPVENTECVDAIGGHYNPFSVSLGNLDDQNAPSVNSDYGQDCSPLYPLRCESGDMSGKHGQLSIASAVSGRPSYTYVDPNLYLTGAYTIVGRSIGLHLPTGPLFACAAIQRFYVAATYLRVRFNVGDYDSVSVVSRLTMTTSVAPGDVLVLAQEVEEPQIVNGTSIQCASVTMRVLGATQQAADANYALLSPRMTVFTCSGTTPTTPTISSGSTLTISLLVMAACLLLALTHN